MAAPTRLFAQGRDRRRGTDIVPEIGLYALRLALLVAVVGAAMGVAATRSGRGDYAAMTRRAVAVCFGLSSVAMLALWVALGTGDYRIAYVARHSASTMPLGYRLGALWGGQAGSLLLWLWISLAYAAAAARRRGDELAGCQPLACSLLLGNATFFLFLLNFVTNPLEQLDPGQVISDGQGLNPLLQHPLMLIHPVLLYLGFTGFAVPAAFALASLLIGDFRGQWLRAMRRWTLVPWLFLSVGILLGGRWAYEVLGWGGYWAWDPVENASLMPWLPATAYLHSAMIQEKRGMLKIWNLVLIGLTYGLCLFGTFLTRSGIVQSVHSFTNAGWFGYSFLAYLLVVTVFYGWALIARRHSLRSTNRLESLLSREASFVLNNWLFLGILVVVFSGTMFPVLSELLRDVEMSLGPAYFNFLVGPLVILLLLLAGVGPLIAWRRASSRSLRRQFVFPLTAAALAALISALGLGSAFSIYPFLFWTLAAFVTATIVQEYGRALRARRRHGEGTLRALAVLLSRNQRRYGGYVVHLGVVLILVGVSGAAFDEERLENLRPGQRLEMNGVSLEYLTAQPLPEQHYGGAVARLALYREGEPLAVLLPEHRMYWLEQQPASIPAIYSTLREDLYVILTAIEADGSATLKIHRNPLVNWVWIGGFAFVLGTALVLWPHPEAGAAISQRSPEQTPDPGV